MYNGYWNRGDGSPRVINMHPTLGKVLDKVIYRRLQSHLERNIEIYKNQGREMP